MTKMTVADVERIYGRATPNVPLDTQVLFNALRAMSSADYVAAVNNYVRQVMRGGMPPYPRYEDDDARRVRLCRSATREARQQWEAKQ